MKHLPPPTVGELEAEGKRVWFYCRDCCHAMEKFASMLVGLDPSLNSPELKQRARCSKCTSKSVDVKPQLDSTPLPLAQ